MPGSKAIGCAVVALSLVWTIVLPAQAEAAPSSSTISLDQAAPHFMDTVTFTVTTAERYPYIELKCWQSGNWIYDQIAGHYAGYPLPQSFVLGPTNGWLSGAADCTASLFWVDRRGRYRTIATTSFAVLP